MTYSAGDIEEIILVPDGDGDERRWRFTPAELEAQIRREEDPEMKEALRFAYDVMMSYFPRPKPVEVKGQKIDVDVLKARTDIVRVAERYTQLHKSGPRLVARCPLHESKGMPLTIYPDKQDFHCFHCQAHGDVIAMVMAFERLDFKGAIGLLT